MYLSVPPNILDSLSTESTVAVREHQNITLTCKADGYPPPKLMWKREDGQVISINKHHKGTSLYYIIFCASCNTSNHSGFILHIEYRKSIFHTVFLIFCFRFSQFNSKKRYSSRILSR